MEPELEGVTLQTYEGGRDFKGRCHGHGRALFRTGATYNGQWVAGQMHGLGTLSFPDGITYSGGFVNNTICGDGKYEWPSGAVYIGHMEGGRRHGRGRMSFADSPAVYDGEWAEGVRQGYGVLYYNIARTASYTGDWHHDQKHGHGVMQYVNGDMYDGEWRDDLKCGRGTMVWASLKQQYSGEWMDNQPNGVGTHIWFQQATAPDVAPASNKTHAMLLMYNRYHGHFMNGRRHGYGVLYYATGARYEGEWVDDQKHGEGCFVFENGSVWAGTFECDRPLIDAGGTPFGAHPSSGVAVNVPDLLEEEESPAASTRGINNVLMCYNSELRALYDKYSKRPSANLSRSTPRPSFALVSSQLWDLLSDARLITAHTSLSDVGRLLVLARRPPQALAAFRQRMRGILEKQDDEADCEFWAALDAESTGPAGPHAPMNELLFREFCELLLRIAALRYQGLPGLERRLHTMINAHLLSLVGKAKAGVSAPPKTSFQVEFSAIDTVQVLGDLQTNMRRFFAAAVCGGVPPADEKEFDSIVGRRSTTPRQLLQLLQNMGALEGSLLTVHGAAHALTFNFLASNSYEAVQRLRIDNNDSASNDASATSDQQSKGGAGVSDGGAAGEEPGLTGVVGPDVNGDNSSELEQEVDNWLDVAIVYPEVVEALARCAYVAVPDADRLALRLTAFWNRSGGLVSRLNIHAEQDTA